jgi:hypothetical protein
MTTIYSVMYPTQQPTGTTGASTTGASGTNTTTSMRSPGSLSLTAAAAPSAQDTKSWYEAMAKAWGQALNQQAQVITQLSDQVSNAGQDQPSQVTQLTAESMRFSFLATNASTATTSVGEALQTLGRKQ